MNRIKDALAAGKAIHCRTEDEAKTVFGLVGSRQYKEAWSKYGDTLCVREGGTYGDCGWFEAHEYEIIPFSALTRSRLANALGVEDGQEFTFRGSEYQLLNGCVQWHDEAGGVWHVSDPINICHMINYPEEIQPCPVWSEDSIQAARVFENTAARAVRRWDGGALWLMVGDTERIGIGREMFPEIQPGQTVKLSEIK